MDTILDYVEGEFRRQDRTLSLIASESITYPEILKVFRSPFNKYIEGHVENRFYGGCGYIDLIEGRAIEYAKSLFSCKHANVQALSGSIANMAIYRSLLKPGDNILSMSMDSGGHLTHSSPHSMVSDLYRVFTYGVDRETLRLNYDQIREMALKVRPRLIIAGGSSYPFMVDFQKFREIADLVGAYLFADISHLSALIIADIHPHCFPHAHVAMTTTHKLLRGVKGAIILWNDDNLPIDKSLFPGIQGGFPFTNLAANAIALSRANGTEFLNYARSLVRNTGHLIDRFRKHGISVLGGDTHFLLLNTMQNYGLTGVESAKLLEGNGLVVNANLMPFDTRGPRVTSGIRIGTPILTILNYSREQCHELVDRIHRVLGRNEG